MEFDRATLIRDVSSFTNHAVIAVEYVKYDYDRELDVMRLTFDDGRSLLVNDPEIRGEVKEMTPEQEQHQCHQAKLLMFHS